MRKNAALWIIPALIWLALAGVGQWRAAGQLHEPPSWDTYSYAVKAANFWAGEAVNPLNVAPSVRPPGTILMSYPFGFDVDHRGFYFRSVFLPVLLCVLALYIAGFARRASPADHMSLAGGALVLGGMPMFFQFQLGDGLPAASFWGMVDGFLTGVSAVAMACAVRSVRTASIPWALGAALCAAFAFMVKPSGALVMALVGVSWLILAVGRHGWSPRGYVAVSFGGAAAVFAFTALAAFTSDYFSPSNVAFGQAALSVMAQDFMSLSELSLAELWLLLKLSVGVAGLAFLGVGMFAALSARHTAALGAAVLCLAVGIWFWLFQAGAEVVRYFLPFPAMAMILLWPSLTELLGRWPGAARAAVWGALVAPAILTVVLLFVPAPPTALQRALGINLAANAYQAENEQGAALLAHWRASGETGRAYFVDTSAAIRNVYAAVEYAELAEPGRAVMPRTLPLDWKRTSTFRLDELGGARYLIFEPVRAPQTRRAILERREVPGYRAETELINAWASELTEAQGVVQLSDTRVRVLEVVAPEKFAQALSDLREGYRWSQAFRDANRQIWWSREELQALIENSEAASAQARFNSEDGPAAKGVVIEATALRRDGEGLHLDVWVSGTMEAGAWVLFAHLLDAGGAMVDNAQADLAAATAPEGKPIRLYRLLYPRPPAAAVTAALGFFMPTPDGLQTLVTPAQPSSWDRRRYDVALPPPK